MKPFLPLLITLTAVIVSGFTGIFIPIWSDSIHFITPTALGIILFAQVARLLWKYRNQSLNEPLVWVLLGYSGYPVGALYVIFNKELTFLDLPIYGEGAENFLNFALFLAIASLLFMNLGYNSNLSRKLTNNFSKLKLSATFAQTRAYLWFGTIIFSCIGFTRFYFAMNQAGGILYVLNNVGYRTEIRTLSGVDSIFDQILLHIFPTATVLFAAILFYEPRLWLRVTFLLHFTLSSLMLVTMGGRNLLLTFWLIVLTLYLRRHIATFNWRKFTIVVIILVFVTVGLRSARTVTLKMRTANIDAILMNLQDTFTPENFLDATAGWHNLANIHMLTLIVYTVPDKLDYQYGRTFLRYLAPTSLLPDKLNVQTGLFLRQELVDADSTYGVPPSIIGELYLNFGILGLVIMFFFGIFLQAVKQFSMTLDDIWVDLFYSIIVNKFIFMFVITEFSIALQRTFVYLMPITFLFLVFVFTNRIASKPTSRHLLYAPHLSS